MGAFLMVKKGSQNISVLSALNVFETMGLPSPQKFDVGQWELWSWSKIRSGEDHFVSKGKSLLVCAGTPVYRNSNDLKESLQLIMQDLLNDRFDFNMLRGSYGLIWSSDGSSIKILTDQAGIWNIYFDKKAEIISSSFLAIVFGLKDKVSLNRLAATEVITSGRLIGPDTLFNEVMRLEISLMNTIGGIEIVKNKTLMDFPEPIQQSFNESVQEQIGSIDDYFHDIKNFSNNYGVDSGLTAGHDSRMMLIQLRKHFKNYQVHSFWRKQKDLELSIAEKVAEKANVPLKVVEGKHHLDKTEKELEDTLRKSLFFYDGHIRMHCFLMEDYHTTAYRSAVLGDKKLGLNGIGGEQYRNEWHMELPFWSLDYFTRYALTRNLSGKCFTDKISEKKYLAYLKAKLVNKLGLKAGAKKLSKRSVQKYYNEIYVASLMGVRTNAENALGHFITPFIDRQLTRCAYRSLPHHGISYGFQQAMIRRMDPGLASVQSGYGYNFTDGEPFTKKIKYLIKELTPVWLYEKKINKKIGAIGNSAFNLHVDKYPIFQNSVRVIRSYKLPLDEKVFTARPDIMPVYLSLAYFLHYLSKENRLAIE